MLADLEGKPVIRWIYENCLSAGVFSRVLIATDHPAVVEAARGFGAEAVMTDAGHSSGTERVAEVARGLSEEIVVNVQGDEPFLGAGVLRPLVEAARRPGVEVATVVTPIRSGEELADPSVVKAVLDNRGLARWFSRWPIPFNREAWPPGDPWGAAGRTDPSPAGTWWKHLGVYAFRRETLLSLVTLPPCAAEHLEKLEQLRWLYYGVPILCVPVEGGGVAIDTPEDLERARTLIGVIIGVRSCKRTILP